MRSFSFVLLMLVAVSVNAEERTWTISTGTYTVAAELVEVRGDIAYLKIGDNIEHIPFARLSGADQLYITSQSRPVVFPGPAEDKVTAESLPGSRNEFTPFPRNGAIAEQQQGPARNITVNKPLVEPELIPPAQAGATVRSNANQVEELPSVPASVDGPQSRSLLVNPRVTADPNKVNPNNRSTSNNSSTNARKSAQPQKQNQNNNTSNKNRSRDEERRGLFGGRTRLLGK